jgi:hypothetical protein
MIRLRKHDETRGARVLNFFFVKICPSKGVSQKVDPNVV